MERIYFSKQNFSIIYNILRKKITNALNYDISNDETFNNELIKVMKSLYGKRNTFNIPSNLSDIDRSRYLSQKVINVATPYFIDTIKKSGIRTIIQPGGSIRDQEVIDACDEYGFSMLFTNTRCFKH